MCRISESFLGKRKNFVTIAFASCAAIGALLSGSAVCADDVGNGVENPALKIDIGCAQRDLELFSMIERNGNNGLSTVATLVETSDLCRRRATACNGIGDVDNARALYDTAIRRLGKIRRISLAAEGLSGGRLCGSASGLQHSPAARLDRLGRLHVLEHVLDAADRGAGLRSFAKACRPASPRGPPQMHRHRARRRTPPA